MRDLGPTENPLNFMAFGIGQAEEKVKEAMERDMKAEEEETKRQQAQGHSNTLRHNNDVTMASPSGSSSPSGFTNQGHQGQGSNSGDGFNFNVSYSSSTIPTPTAGASTSASTATTSNPTKGPVAPVPTRRRSGAPTSIPNFPSSTQIRDTVIPFSPSPTESPASAPSPVSNKTSRSPSVTSPQPPPTSLGQLPLPTPSFPMNAPASGGMQSPWHMLAATSGAPTPSIDGPGRNSPHLGSPFERLNIGGSWSGANLDQGIGSGSGRRGSLEPPAMSLGLSTSPSKASPLSSSGGGFVFGNGNGADVKSPLGAPPVNRNGNSDNKMAVDPPSEPSTSKKPPLPASLAARRASLPKNHVNIHGGSAVAMSGSPLAVPPSMTLSSLPSSSNGNATKPRALGVGQLGPVLAKTTTLILDLRPPSSYQSSHLPDSHSLPIPSTLLRRPAFTIQKLTQMLSAASMEAVSHWADKSDIVMVDQDSESVPDGSILNGLASKFTREGFNGHLWFVKGGLRAVQSSGGALVGDDEGNNHENQTSASSMTNGGLMAGGMGRIAFQRSSTGGGPNTLSPGQRSPRETPGTAFRLDPFDYKPSSPKSPAAQSVTTMKSGSTRSGAGSGKSSNRISFNGAIDCDSANGTSLQPANPFFDNIRQNLELSHGGITERIPLHLPDEVASRAREMPKFLSELVSMPSDKGAEKMANQFYEVELGEQRRLQSVMNWHTQDSGAFLNGQTPKEQSTQQTKDKDEVDRLQAWGIAQQQTRPSSPTDDEDEEHYFPFSITAGVERGTKNRYKNIWPYDFSRVRLGTPVDDSDYINASYVQPRGTTRRYIATQGPLDATYCDFWTLIWEQDVRVIVMLTKQFEGGSIKCGNYWEEQQYGPVHLKLVSQSGGEDRGYTAPTGFDFGFADKTPTESSEKPATHIKRTFHVTHDKHPEAQPREIVQIQCVSWPDFDVPESADVLLSLIRQVDEEYSKAHGVARDSNRQQDPPVLVHCSAGVGRTGSFIVVDAILDALRWDHTHPAIAQPSSQARLPAKFDPVQFSISSQANTGERPIATPHYPVERMSEISTVPDIDDRTADATDRQYQTDSFAQHRSHPIPSNSSTGEGFPRRPSFGTASSSTGTGTSGRRSDKLSEIERTMGMPQPITSSGVRHRAATPLREMENPVLEVLEGMRVQRMSLVQSLRQYVFVYRAIITAYVQMLDQEQTHDRDSSDTVPTMSSINTNLGGGSSSEDDIHSKRRASPTELAPGSIEMTDIDMADGEGASRGGAGANLVKRPSFKKMRSSALESISLASGSKQGSATRQGSASSASRHGSPKKTQTGTK